MAQKGVNISLAMTLADGLRAYLQGNKEKALLDIGTATDEIVARMARSAERKVRERARHDDRLVVAPAGTRRPPAARSTRRCWSSCRAIARWRCLDQRALPAVERYDRLDRVEQVATAIETLAVRGAPAIGVAAAYGVVLAAGREGPAARRRSRRRRTPQGQGLRSTRPTAVNLAWAIDRDGGHRARGSAALDPAGRVARLAAAARAIHTEDVAACWAMGKIGAQRVPDGAVVLTHCNAGALATGGMGTGARRGAGGARGRQACESSPARRDRCSRERGSRRGSSRATAST